MEYELYWLFWPEDSSYTGQWVSIFLAKLKVEYRIVSLVTGTTRDIGFGKEHKVIFTLPKSLSYYKEKFGVYGEDAEYEVFERFKEFLNREWNNFLLSMGIGKI